MTRWFLALTVALFLVQTGCSDRSTDTRDIFDPGLAGGGTTASDAGGTPVDTPVRSLCSPGTSRCVGENSPLIDRCDDRGEALERDRCSPGEVCRNRRCEPFACEPGTQLCVGNVQAVCDDTGAAIEQTEECEGAAVCEGGRCIDLCDQASRNGSYIGCEYVAQRLPNYYTVEFGSGEYPFGVVVSNAHPFADATVEVKNQDRDVALWAPRYVRRVGAEQFFVESRILAANGTREPIEEFPVVIPPGGAAVILVDTPVDIARITSDRPVTAYQFSPYCCNSTFTNDASLLYPVDTWGTRYRAIGYPTFPQIGDPYLAIYTNIQQTITVSGPQAVFVETSSGPRVVEGSFVAEPNTINYLRPTASGGDTSTGADISGVALEGSSPFSVFSGHPCTFVPEDSPACDHLEEQLPPANTLGRRYLLTPVLKRSNLSTTEGVYWRVTADEAATITFDPPFSELRLLPAPHEFTRQCVEMVVGNSLSLEAGETCEFGTDRGVSLESSGDVIVAGVVSGQQSTGLASFGANAGDPSLFVLPPVAQFRDSYSFIAPPTYARNFVAVSAPVGEAVVLDGRNVEEAFRSQRRTVKVDGRTWEIFVVAIESGLHQISSDEPFGIMVYAMDDYVSYAFVGGLDLLPKGAD